MPGHGRAARGRREQSGQHADRRRLAGAVGAEKPEDLAGAHVEGDAIHGGKGAEAAREVDDLDRERRAHAARVPSGTPMRAMKLSSTVGGVDSTAASANPREARNARSSAAMVEAASPVRAST